MNYDYLLKLLIIGNSGVGKSCILLRFSDEEYTDSFITTIGVDFRIKPIHIDNKRIKLQLWDTAGQERFRTITSSYYRGAHGIIVVYDITNQESFNNVTQWATEIKRYANDNVEVILIGNKSDLAAKRKITYEQGKQLAESLNCGFLETSAKKSTNIDEAFIMLSSNVLRRMLTNTQEQKPPIITGVPIKKQETKCIC